MYELPSEGYSGFVSDVIRVETFGPGCDVTKREDKSVKFTVLADAEEIAVFYSRPTQRGVALVQVSLARMLRAEYSEVLEHDESFPIRLLAVLFNFGETSWICGNS